MDESALTQQLTFLREIDRLKCVVRQSPLLDRSRKENSAEHSWHLAMYAWLLQEYAAERVNVAKVIQMLLLHDVVEIDAGDMPIHGAKPRTEQAALEARAAVRLFGLLPEAQRDQLVALWLEFEQAETADARFAKALDRFQPLLVNVFTGGGTWVENDVSYEQVMQRYGPEIKKGAPRLWRVCEQWLAQHFAEQGDPPGHLMQGSQVSMTKHYIRPDVQAFLKSLQDTPRPAINETMIPLIRQMPPEAMASMDLPVGELGEVRDVVMPGPGGEMLLRLYDARASRGAGPAVVFYHGGGFVVGSIDTHAALAAEIARGLDLPVISVEYRLAPENPWPAAPDDAEAAARWIAASGAAFGREFTGLVLCGDSAGGNLAAITTLALRDAAAPLSVLMQLLIYPLTDYSRQFESGKLFADGYGMTGEEMDFYDRAYGPDRHHWRASPATAALERLPPTLIATASLDPLRDDGRAFAKKLEVAGVTVVHREAEGAIQGFASCRRAMPSGRRDLEEILAEARSLLRHVAAG